MPPVLPENSLLLTQVRQFTTELLRWKQVLEQQFPENADNGSDSGLLLDDQAAWLSQSLQARAALLSLLDRQASRTQDFGGTQSLALYREAQYVLAVLADELILNAHWAGRYQWRLLEDELFRSHAAGDIFFDRLDRLLAPTVLTSRELALVYLQALALDFRGRYRGADPQNRLERYRRQIYQRVFGHTPEQEAQIRLSPGSYGPEIEEEPHRLASAHLWWWSLAVILVVWVIVSSLLWHHVASPVATAAQRINHFRSVGQVSQ